METVARFIAEPDAGVLAPVMEFAATTLNPTQGLIKGERLLTLLRTSPGTDAVLASFERLLDTLPWAVYDVRHTISPRADGKTNHARSVRILDNGPPSQMHARLEERAQAARVAVTIGDPAFPDDIHPRTWLRRREPLLPTSTTPTAEQFLVIAPATAISKTGPAFPARLGPDTPTPAHLNRTITGWIHGRTRPDADPGNDRHAIQIIDLHSSCHRNLMDTGYRPSRTVLAVRRDPRADFTGRRQRRRPRRAGPGSRAP